MLSVAKTVSVFRVINVYITKWNMEERGNDLISRCYPSICLEELRKTTKHLRQDRVSRASIVSLMVEAVRNSETSVYYNEIITAQYTGRL
jgi:rRNA-processing protein FCF1